MRTVCHCENWTAGYYRCLWEIPKVCESKGKQSKVKQLVDLKGHQQGSHRAAPSLHHSSNPPHTNTHKFKQSIECREVVNLGGSDHCPWNLFMSHVISDLKQVKDLNLLVLCLMVCGDFHSVTLIHSTNCTLGDKYDKCHSVSCAASFC